MFYMEMANIIDFLNLNPLEIAKKIPTPLGSQSSLTKCFHGLALFFIRFRMNKKHQTLNQMNAVRVCKLPDG
jgi:hypothetical protein